MDNSRLSKLLDLLAAPSGVLREQAASQIAEIVGTHAAEAGPLLLKVRAFLHHGSWDARYAAAKTVGEISSVCFEDKDDNSRDGGYSTSSVWSVDFDLGGVIRSGFVLVGSEGQEYDKAESEVDASSQKFRLKQQLGVPAVLETGVEDFVSEEDFLVSVESSESPNFCPAKVIKLEEEESRSYLENELLECKAADGNQKLWWFYRLLCYDLYDPSWIVRHGAALSLKEIQKHLSRSPLYLPRIFASARHLFFVLAADRFDDYVGSHAVAPVRETCAQVVGSSLPLLPIQGKEALIKILIQYTSSPETKPWQCVHAGLLTLKYSLPFILPRRAEFPDIVDVLLQTVCRCVQFQNEEIIVAASQAIAPNLGLISSCTAGDLTKDLLTIVWNLLLTSRYDIADDWVRGLLHIATELGASLPRPYDAERISTLASFLDHPSVDVCGRAVKCLTIAAENADSVWHEQGILHILRMVFFKTLSSRDQQLFALIKKLWLALIRSTSVSDSILSVCPFFGQWLASLMTPENYPLVDPVLLGFDDRRIFIGGEDVMALNELDRFAAVTSAKLNASHLLAHLAISLCEPKVAENENPSCSLEICFLFHLNSSSIVRKSVVCMLLVEWAKIKRDAAATDVDFPFSFCEEIQGHLINSNIVYEENLPKLTELNSLYQNIVQYSNGIITPTLNFNTFAGVREATEWCRCAIESTFNEVGNKIASLVKEFSWKLFDVQQQTSRLFCWFSCVSVRFHMSHEKINPIIIPLMDVVKSERAPSIAEEAAECLATLLIQTAARQPSPSGKILKNLVCIHCSDHSKTPQFLKTDETNSDDKVYVFNFDKRLSLDCDFGRKKTICSLITVNDFHDKSVAAANAGMVLRKVCLLNAANLPVVCANLWKMLNELPDEEGSELICSLQILETVFGSLPVNLRQQLASSSESKLLKFILSDNFAIRNMACRCLAAFASSDVLFFINQCLTKLLAYLSDPDDESARLGSMEVIFTLVEEAEVDLIGVASVVALPVLARMSDTNSFVRRMASQCFGTLVKLLPLELKSETKGLSEKVRSMLLEQRQFLRLLARPEELAPMDLSTASVTTADLRPYQKDGVNWLLFLNKYNLHGILCDDMGLGKTLQTLCCLAFSLKSSSSPAPSLIVCPKTLVQHWVVETGKFFDDSILRATSVDNAGSIDPSSFEKFNIFVVSYDYLRKDSKLFESRRWNYCILDEGHIIKNPKTLTSKAVMQLKAEHRLVLSGTPVQNNVLELWSLFEFLIPGYMGDRKLFQNRFGKPILGARDAKASSAEMSAGQAALESLHKMALPFILRRRKADVLDELPPKIVQDYYCALSPLQKRLYQDFSQTVLDNLIGDSTGAQRNAFQILTYLRKLCDHPCLVLKSDHSAYAEIVGNLKQSYGCENLEDISLSGKIMALKQLLRECGIGRINDEFEDESEVHAVSAHRALIFCQFKSVVELIADYFSQNNFGSLTFLRLDGSVPPNERQSVADKFNRDPSVDVLLLTTHIGGLGLNLTGADVVIFVDHDWNPAKDLQAMDRAHRIGQKRTVNVYRLISQGTLEEKIMRLQLFKSQNADAVIGEQNRSLASMATEQLLDLLTVDNPRDSKNRQVKSKKASTKSSNGAEQLLVDLPALWDQSQYEDAFDFNKFLQSMR